MRYVLIIFVSFFAFRCGAQNVQMVAPKGVYKQINTDNDIRILRVFVDSTIDRDQREKLADSVKQSPNIFIPPDLYGLSYYLFATKRQSEAMFWFYLAQLRARYDVNRCADKTASASNYNMTFGPQINEYAFKHLDSLKQAVAMVIAFERNNDEAYDQRWINLTGMGAMTSALDDKNISKKDELSLPADQWPAIKSKTIVDYAAGFNEFLENLKKQE